MTNLRAQAEALVRQHGSILAAARESGIPRQTLQSRLRKGDARPQFAALPDDDIPVTAIIDPRKDGPEKVHCFAEMDAAAEYLAWRRSTR